MNAASPFLERDDTGRLRFAGHDLSALAERFGSPLYVYAQAAIDAAIAAYQRGLAGCSHRLHYAVKANGNLAVLQTMRQRGLGFDIVSIGELGRVLAAGGEASACVYSGVGKSKDDLRAALQAGVHAIHVESASELKLLAQVAHELGCAAPFALRVNPHVDAGTHPYIATALASSKFGIAMAQALGLYQWAAGQASLSAVGLACHIGSQITSISPYLEALDQMLDLYEALKAQGIALPSIGMGGGLGLNYGDGGTPPPAPEAWIGALRARMAERGHAQLTLALEPGRSVVGSSGVLLTRVLHLKRGAVKNHCVVDAGMNDLLRPALYEAWMPLANCRTGDVPTSGERWEVVGPVCESGDWLARERALAVEAGDVLAVLCAGAYGMSMASSYNSRPLPAEVMLVGDEAKLVRTAQPINSLWAGEVLL